jgi:hypothetical protein
MAGLSRRRYPRLARRPMFGLSGDARTNGRNLPMTVLARFRSSLATFAAATRVAAAIENSRRPRTVDLRRLGIDPQAFTSIGLG